MARQTTRPRPQPARAQHRGGAVARGARSRRASRRWPVLAGLLVVVAVAAVALYVTVGRDGGRAAGGALATLTSGDFHSMAFSGEPSVVFFGHHNGMRRSDDGGRTWKTVVERPNFDAMGMAVSPRDPRRLYLAGHDIFQASADGGATWQPVAHNLPGTDIHGFAMSPADPDRLYAFVVGRGLFASADGGRTWERLAGQVPADVMVLAAGGSPETLYAGSMRAGVLRSADGGKSWSPATSGLGPRMVFALAADPTAAGTAYAGVDGGLYKSTDAGASWRRLPFPGDNAATVAVSPAQPNVVIAITVKDSHGLVYRSDDGGESWGSGG